MRDPLTDRQREGLDFIAGFIARHGYPPALREIGKGLGIGSTNGVRDMLFALEKKGWISREPMLSRAIRVLP